MKYLLVLPKGGLNDQLCVISRALDFCATHSRQLLLDMSNCCYKIDVNKFFTIPNVISDPDTITNILQNKSLYPSILQTDPRFAYYRYKDTCFEFNGRAMNLPKSDVDEDIIVYVKSGGGHQSEKIFMSLQFTNLVKEYIHSKKIDNYICLQVRNTDIKCDYKTLISDNLSLITSSRLYVATDDKNVLNYLESQNIKFENFCNFPTDSYKNLHYADVDPEIKFLNVLLDIYIIVNAKELITNSIGGFIRLCKNLRKNKNFNLLFD
jgi:hypothetical protein